MAGLKAPFSVRGIFRREINLRQPLENRGVHLGSDTTAKVFSGGQLREEGGIGVCGVALVL